MFQGHPELLVGFNNFLPAGYKVEVEGSEIYVHQPGIHVMTLGAHTQLQVNYLDYCQPHILLLNKSQDIMHCLKD